MDFKIPDTPDELLRQSKKGFDQFNKWVPTIIIFSLLLGVIVSSFYKIEPGEVGVIQRFGKYDRTTEPGLHWKLPFNIEKLNIVSVEKVRKEEFGFRTLKAGIKTQYSSRSFNDESLMLTGDLNVLDVRWIVQYRIKDPVKALFNVRDPIETVRDVSEVVMRQVIGDSTVSEALTTRRETINANVQEYSQTILDEYQSGIDIDLVKLQAVNPPNEVKASFNEENEAEQEREKVINQAWKAYNKVVPKARGEAEKTIQEAEGYALKRVNQAKGDATKFTDTWNAYKNAKDVTRRRLYLETLADVLPRLGQTYIMEPEGNNVLPLLNLSEGK